MTSSIVDSNVESELTNEDIQRIAEILREDSAMVLNADKAYLVESRLATVAESVGAASVAALIRGPWIQETLGLRRQIVEALAIHESTFFRDAAMFDALRESIVPYFLGSRKSSKQLSIWSAACAKGKEVYSVSMLLEDSFPELAQWRVNLIASDFSTQILEEASKGLFNQHEVNRGLPASLLLKHFSRDGLDWQISKVLRDRVTFDRVPLQYPFPASMPQMDIVLLRNVMIYFDHATRSRVLANIHRILKQDGVLILGGAETTFQLHHGFRRVELTKDKVFFQRTDARGGGPNAGV